ncbi:MAG: FAD:protein FMN transferase [Acidobacteria bacterium]|nr:FAD:protein FMN transferase [Acidobacteriota bacterium]
MLQLQHKAMATVFEIRSTGEDPHLLRQAARAAFDVIDRLEHMLSRYIENSDISRINHLAAGESALVGYETMQCLQLAQLLYAETGGAFDVSIGTGFTNLELVPEESRVVARADDVRLDLGAIGKGYAVDRMADVLEDWDVSRVLIQAGASSVLALDPSDHEDGWPLTLSEPGQDGLVLVRLSVRQYALGASGIRKGDHIVNGLEGTPVRSRSAAWVSAPRHVLADLGRRAGVEASAAAVADALSTAFMISPVEEIEACCRSHDGLEAWILADTFQHFPANLQSE